MYVFDLDGLGWDGMADLEVRGFWEGEGVSGSISHISMHGTSTSVPEPGTMFLLGTGLVGLAGLRRRFKK